MLAHELVTLAYWSLGGRVRHAVVEASRAVRGASDPIYAMSDAQFVTSAWREIVCRCGHAYKVPHRLLDSTFSELDLACAEARHVIGRDGSVGLVPLKFSVRCPACGTDSAVIGWCSGGYVPTDQLIGGPRG